MLLKVQTNLSLLKSSLFALLALLLSGCETELSPDPIRIVAPDRPFREEWFIGSPFEYEFGIDGGSGSYSVEYLKSPPDGFGFETPSNENTVDMQVETLEGARPLFRLFGVPHPGPGEDLLTETELNYYIKINDGSQTEVFEYSVNLKPNTLDLGDAMTIFEGSPGSIAEAITALRVAENAEANPLIRQTVCETIRTEPVRNSVEIDGRDVSFFYQVATLDAPTNERFEVSFRVTSGYQEEAGELDAFNVGRARLGSDVLDQVSTLVFNPYETECLFKIGVYTDDLVESEEDFQIEFFDAAGAPVKLSTAILNASIRDDDSTVVYDPTIEVINLGESASVEFVSENVTDATIEVLVGVNQTETTASVEEFTLFPETGVLVFDGTVKSQLLTVAATARPRSSDTRQDKKIRVVSSVDAVNDVEEALEFVINEWGGSHPDSETVSEPGLFPVDMEVSEDGDVFVLSRGMSVEGNDSAYIRAYTHSGQILFPGIQITKQGVDVRPIAIESYTDSETKLLVLMEVDGLFGNRAWGGVDFALAVYSVTGDALTLDRVYQDGSEFDDEVSGLAVNINGNVLVSGITSGLTLSGSAGEVISGGGKDGFLYYYNSLGASDPVAWKRFVGSAVDESVLSVISSRSDSVALTLTDKLPFELGTRLIDLVNADDLTESGTFLRSSYDIDLGGLIYDQDQSRFIVFGGSRADLPSDTLTATASEDAFLLSYRSTGAQNGVATVSTPGSDRFTVGATLSDSDLVAFGGETTGSISGNTNRGLQDGMLAIIDLEEGFEVAHSTQFGTPGNDYVLDLEAVGNHKFLMLWAEDFTSGDGSLTYRVTAFDRKARKMSPDPQ